MSGYEEDRAEWYSRIRQKEQSEFFDGHDEWDQMFLAEYEQELADYSWGELIGMEERAKELAIKPRSEWNDADIKFMQEFDEWYPPGDDLWTDHRKSLGLDR
jgi:hypothetical protein